MCLLEKSQKIKTKFPNDSIVTSNYNFSKFKIDNNLTLIINIFHILYSEVGRFDNNK